MIGMTFSSFLTLLVIGAVCALVLYNMVKFTAPDKAEGYLGQLIMGWIGAWLGSPVLGHWGWMVPAGNVYIVPAILGSLASIYLTVAMLRVADSLIAPLAHRGSVPSERTRVA